MVCVPISTLGSMGPQCSQYHSADLMDCADLAPQSPVFGSCETPPPISTCYSSSSKTRYQQGSSLVKHCINTVFLKESATQFYLKFNGKPFSSIESAICRLVFVERVEITKGSQEAPLPASGGREVVELPSCPVCLERLDDSVLTVLCNHSFHTQCLNRWEDST